MPRNADNRLYQIKYHHMSKFNAFNIILTSFELLQVIAQPLFRRSFPSFSVVFIFDFYFFVFIFYRKWEIMSSGSSEPALICNFWWWLRHWSEVRLGSSWDSLLNTFLVLRRCYSRKSCIFSYKYLMYIQFYYLLHEPQCLVLTNLALSRAFLFLLSQRQSGILFFSSPELGTNEESQCSDNWFVGVFFIQYLQEQKFCNHNEIFTCFTSFVTFTFKTNQNILWGFMGQKYCYCTFIIKFFY